MYPPSLLDTDILSELFKGNPSVKTRASEYLSDHNRLILSLVVASIAVMNKLVLVTNNTNHFSRIQGLLLDNWKVLLR